MQTHSITLGQNIGAEGKVTNQMWLQFLETEVVTRLDYATITDAIGIYKGTVEIAKSSQWQLTNVQLNHSKSLTNLSKWVLFTNSNSDKKRSSTKKQRSRLSNSHKAEAARVGLLTLALYLGWWSAKRLTFFKHYKLFQMCRPQPYMLYNKSIQNRISIHVQQRSNTNVQRTSSNEQNRNARSSSQSDTGRNGKEKLWTTEVECLRGLVHIRPTLSNGHVWLKRWKSLMQSRLHKMIHAVSPTLRVRQAWATPEENAL